MVEEVILVNERDEPAGRMEKIEAHQKGVLHRAFSVFIFNQKGEMLLQQRAVQKYHSGGLWTNACCSHPRPGEETLEAAQRRLMEEMGIDTPIKKIFEFTYQATFENGLYEYEFDHVFAGGYNGVIRANPEEVMDYCFKSPEDLRSLLKTNPRRFTAWFHLAFPKVETWLSRNKISEL
jgi:isopentenyl-diphosphate Delta-isomerase